MNIYLIKLIRVIEELYMESINKLKILIADDDNSSLEILANILQNEGYFVVIAHDGTEVLDCVSNDNFDLIILDIMMPKLDGFQTCKYLKQRNETKDIPVIFLTAFNDTINRLRAFKVGGSDYITKPFDSDEVKTFVKINIERKLNFDKIKKHESLLNALIENSSDLIWSVDQDFIVTIANSLVMETTKLTLGNEINIGMNFIDILPEASKIKWREYYERALLGITFTKDEHFEMLGKIFYLEISFNPIYCDNQIIGVSCFARNNASRRKTQLELLQFKSTMDSVEIGLAMADIDGFLIYSNRYFAQMHGYEIEEIIGKSISIFHAHEQLEEIERLFGKVINDGDLKDVNVSHCHRDGSIFETKMNLKLSTEIDSKRQFIVATSIENKSENNRKKNI